MRQLDVTRLETPRLILRTARETDAPFLVRLLNDPGWLRWIGDRDVRDEAGARAYARERLVSHHAEHGFSLLVTELRATGEAIGLCGLIRRETLGDVDLGYALLPAHRGRGLAFEAADAVLVHAREDLALARVVAITLADNAPSARLLTRLGFRFEKRFAWPESGETMSLYGCDPALGTIRPQGRAFAALAAASEREGYRFLVRLAEGWVDGYATDSAAGSERPEARSMRCSRASRTDRIGSQVAAESIRSHDAPAAEQAAAGDARTNDSRARFDGPGESLLGVHDDWDLVGVCALHADPYADEPRLARLRHLYVHPEHRRQGYARRLVESCLARSDGRFDAVRLRSADAASEPFYARLGFLPTDEPQATHRRPL